MAATLYQNLAFGEILGRLGASAQLFGITGALSIFALASGLPFGGYLVDKFGGTRTFLLAQKVSFVANILCLLLFFANASLYVWAAFQIIYGLVASIEVSSRQHFIYENLPYTTGERGLLSVSFEVTLNGLAKIIGYAIGSTLLSSSNPMWAFAFNAMTYFAMGYWIHSNLKKHNIVHKTVAHVKMRFPIKEVWNNAFLRKIFVFETIFAFSLFAINTQAYLLVKNLNTNYNFGWFLVAASSGSFIVNTLYTRKHGQHFKRNIILFSITSLIGLGFLIFHTNFWVCLIGIFLTGASLTNISVITRAQLHKHVQTENKGSILSLYQVNWNMWTGMGTLIFGIMVQYIGFTLSFTMLFSYIALFLLIYLYKEYYHKNIE